MFPAGAVHQLSKDSIYPYPRGLAIESRPLQKWGLDVWQGRIKAWTPPGATTASEQGGQAKAVTRKISMANIPGVTFVLQAEMSCKKRCCLGNMYRNAQFRVFWSGRSLMEKRQATRAFSADGRRLGEVL